LIIYYARNIMDERNAINRKSNGVYWGKGCHPPGG
jgi:hypothetical protein